MTWSLNRKCRTRGNLPIGNLWLVGRSHTYLLWWIMGSPQDSCLTCQVSEDTCDVNSFSFSKTQECTSHKFSVETSAGSGQLPDTSSPPKYMFDTGHFLNHWLHYGEITAELCAMLWNWSTEVGPVAYGSCGYPIIHPLLPPRVLEANIIQKRYLYVNNPTILFLGNRSGWLFI